MVQRDGQWNLWSFAIYLKGIGQSQPHRIHSFSFWFSYKCAFSSETHTCLSFKSSLWPRYSRLQTAIQRGLDVLKNWDKMAFRCPFQPKLFYDLVIQLENLDYLRLQIKHYIYWARVVCAYAHMYTYILVCISIWLYVAVWCNFLDRSYSVVSISCLIK